MKKSIIMPMIALSALAALPRPSGVVGMPLNDVGQDTAKLLVEVNTKLDKVSDDLKASADDALKQQAKAGDLSKETKAATDKLLSDQTELSKSVTALTDKLEALETKNTDVLQSIVDGNGKTSKAQSLGQAVAADEKIKAFLENGAGGACILNVSNAITTAAGSGGGLIQHPEELVPVRMPRRRLSIRQLLTIGSTGSDSVHYRKQTLRTDNTGMVAETVASLASELGWTKAVERVKKVGTHINISEETMADADQLQSEIDSELRYMLDLEEEKQLLAGDNVGENLDGLIPNAPAFVAAAGLPNTTRIDRLRLACLQVALADYIATAFVLNPLDWAGIEMLKVGGTDERYVFGNPHAVATPVLWGKDVAESNTMTANEWLTGDLEMAATLYDRNQTEILISSEHDQNFVEDMLTVKGRKRITLANKRPAAMVTGDFTFV